MSSDVIALLAVVLAAIPAILQLWKPKPKPKSEVRADDAATAEKVSNAWDSFVEKQEARIKVLEDRVIAVEKITTEYRRGTRILIGQLIESGITPKWQPPEEL